MIFGNILTSAGFRTLFKINIKNKPINFGGKLYSEDLGPNVMFLEFVYVESFLENVVSAIQAFNKYCSVLNY